MLRTRKASETAIATASSRVPPIRRTSCSRCAALTPSMSRRMAKELDTRYADWRNETAALPTEFLSDYQTGYITVRPAPRSTYNGTYLWLAVYRTPTTDIANTTTGLSSTPEINSGYHPYLADYIIGKAFSKPGQLTFSQFKSQHHMNNWETNIGKVQAAEWRLKRIETQEIASADEGNS